jgi:hypothetical protein
LPSEPPDAYRIKGHWYNLAFLLQPEPQLENGADQLNLRGPTDLCAFSYPRIDQPQSMGLLIGIHSIRRCFGNL